MWRREHTIDGMIAIDCVYDALDGGGFLPLACCCFLTSLAAHLPCLRCFFLEIGCGGIFRVYVIVVVLVIFIVVVGLGDTVALFGWLLVCIQCLPLV